VQTGLRTTDTRTIRLLTEKDAGRYWPLRLRTLREEVEAFGSSVLNPRIGSGVPFFTALLVQSGYPEAAGGDRCAATTCLDQG
jgi:hypothetical protein